MSKFLNTYSSVMPLIRICDGFYLIGTKKRQVKLINKTCMVRCGGGYQSIETFVHHVEGGELERLKHLLRKAKESGGTAGQVFTDLVKQAGAEAKDTPKLVKLIKQQMKRLRARISDGDHGEIMSLVFELEGLNE
jgi:hypothetical protein